MICTDAFIPTARAQAAICGIPEYPFAVVAHPLGSLGPDELRERAIAALPQVVAILTGRAGEAERSSGPSPSPLPKGQRERK